MRTRLFFELSAVDDIVRLAVAICLLVTCGVGAAQGVVVGRVTRIQDGDSVLVQQSERTITVRLAGIDAPELAQPFGRESREHLKACCFGQIVLVETHGVDRHGRVLGTLDAGGMDCGLEQLRAGMAWHYRIFANEQSIELRHRYTTAERDARRRAIGLWEQPEPIPPWRFRHSNPRVEPHSTP